MAKNRPFREFLYLDVPKVESIISQLDEGLLRDSTSQRGSQSKASAGGGIAQLLNLSGEHGRSRSLQETKVLHDYAFKHVTDLLRTHDLVISSADLPNELDAGTLPFVAVEGSISIQDHMLLDRVARQARAMREAEQSPALPDVGTEVQEPTPDPDVFAIPAKVLSEMWGDVVLSKITDLEHHTFTMIMRRQFMREDTLAFVMRYGYKPAGKWHAFGLITAVPTLQQMDEAAAALANPPVLAAGESIMQNMMPMLDLAQKLVSSLSGVQVPDIAFDPIAVYREIEPMN